MLWTNIRMGARRRRFEYKLSILSGAAFGLLICSFIIFRYSNILELPNHEPSAGHQIGDINTGDQRPVIVGDKVTITYGVSPVVFDDLRKN